MSRRAVAAALTVAVTLCIASDSGAAWRPPDGLVLIARREPAATSLYLRAVCAGVATGDGVVATAAHCVPADPAGRLVVLRDVADLCGPQPATSTPVQARILHDPVGDLVLLSVPGVAAGEPVGGLPPEGAALVAWGWGGLSRAGRECRLGPVQLRMLDEQACAASRDQFDVDDSFLCGVPAAPDGWNTCSGDSGGPVMWSRPDGVLVDVGVTSSGPGCGPGTVGFIAPLG